MKPEEFDDAIRQKLESIHPTYSSSDIDKVFNHVRKSRRFPWKGASGSWLFYTFSAAAMVGITAWMVHSWT